MDNTEKIQTKPPKPVKLYVPIENLEVESEIKLGDVIIHPSVYLQTVIDNFNKVTSKTKNTEEQKKKFAVWYENDLRQHLGKYAFAELEWQNVEEDDLIPKDLTPVYGKVKEVLSVLYLLQKQIVGVFSVEHQKFGLKSELYRSLNCIVALQCEDRSTYLMQREGVLGDWKFINTEINKFSTNTTYNYFNRLLKQQSKSELEKRILSSIVWLYDAAMDFSPVNRFVKLAISLEVLFASGKNQKSFRLARFSTLLSHLYILNNWKCLCPILESHSAKEYVKNVKRLKLPGVCSAYWNLRKWYKIRSDIVHDAKRIVDKNDLSSFEWWTHKLIIATIEVVSKEQIVTLDSLELFLEKEYRATKVTRQLTKRKR